MLASSSEVSGSADDELFATVAGNGVLRTQGVAADAGEVDERSPASWPRLSLSF